MCASNCAHGISEVTVVTQAVRIFVQGCELPRGSCALTVEVNALGERDLGVCADDGTEGDCGND